MQGATSAADRAPPAGRGGASRGRAGLEVVESALLGVARPDPAAAMAAAGWQPDAAERWCRRCGSSVAASARIKLADGAGAPARAGCPRCGLSSSGSGAEGAARPAGRPFQPALGDGVVRLGEYAPPLSHWILALKHGGWRSMGEALGTALGRAVRGELESAALGAQGRRVTGCGAPDHGEMLVPTIVVPAPMPWLRRLARGIDHAGVIAGGVATAIDAPLVPLLRRRSGPAQTSRSASSRRRFSGVSVVAPWLSPWGQHRWVKRAADAAKRPDGPGALLGHFLQGRRRWENWGLNGHRVVLVDDVRTSGSTAAACVQALRELAPREIVVAIVAVRD